MLLTAHNIIYYLLDKGLVKIQAFIDGEFTVRRNDSRNHNFVINKEFDHHSLFIKQVKAKDTEKIETLKVEAAVYWLAQHDAQYQALNSFLPKYLYYDSLNHVLVVEQIKNSYNLHDYYMNTPDLSNALADQLALVLASYHKGAQGDGAQQPQGSYFRMQKPWVFSFAANLEAHYDQENQTAEQQIVTLIRKNPGFIDLLKKAVVQWEAKSLVHNDVKFTNFLIQHQGNRPDWSSLKLIDWELADIGDPAWDVAAIFQNFLTLWVTTNTAEYQQIYRQKLPLLKAQTLMQQFWERYTNLMGFSPQERQENLLKTIQFCALKLLHTCFESVAPAQTLQPVEAQLLQMSFNILRSPSEAAVKLFRIK